MDSWVRRVNTADKRFGEPIEAFAPHAPDDEVLQRLVVELPFRNVFARDE
jgi:hypothetical protein